MNIIFQITVKEVIKLAHFAIIDVGRSRFEIVPITAQGNAYIKRCRGMMMYSKRDIAKSAVKRMEDALNKRIQQK